MNTIDIPVDCPRIPGWFYGSRWFDCVTKREGFHLIRDIDDAVIRVHPLDGLEIIDEDMEPTFFKITMVDLLERLDERAYEEYNVEDEELD